MSFSLLNILEKDQKNQFLGYLKSKSKVKSVKSVALFKAVRLGAETDFENKIGSSAFRGVKKRLLDNLVNFLADDILKKEVSEEIRIIKQLVVARKVLEFGYFKEGFKMLAKIESRASAIDHFSLLTEIYHSQIQYSYHELGPNQEELFDALLANSKAQLNQEKLNMAFAFIKKGLKHTEDIKAFINKAYETFEVDTNEGFNYKSLFQLAEIANSEGAYTNDYYSVNLFFEDKLESIEGSKIDVPKHYTYKVDLMLSLANIYLRKRDFEKCRRYIQKTNEVLPLCPSEFQRWRLYQLSTLTALCHNYTGQQAKGINLLEGLTFVDLKAAYGHLSLASFYFQSGRLKETKQILSNYVRSDSYYEQHIDREWVLNKIYIEVLTAIEQGDIDYAGTRMNSLIRRYATYFKAQKNSHVLPFIKLVRYYCRYPEEVASEQFAQRVEKTIKWKPSEQEDLFLMSVFAWLKAKMTKRPVYEVTLELVSI